MYTPECSLATTKKKIVENINGLMKNCINYGGDSGGPYGVACGGSTFEMEFYLMALLKSVGIDNYKIIWKDDMYPQVVLTYI